MLNFGYKHRFLITRQGRFLNKFDSKLLARLFVYALAHLAERALAQLVFNFVRLAHLLGAHLVMLYELRLCYIAVQLLVVGQCVDAPFFEHI